MISRGTIRFFYILAALWFAFGIGLVLGDHSGVAAGAILAGAVMLVAAKNLPTE